MIWSLADLVSLSDVEVRPDTVAYAFVSCSDLASATAEELLDPDELDRAHRL